jgi:outer membrane lipoprotein-sorting protein
MQKLQSEAKMVNKYKEVKDVNVDFDKDVYKERKKLIEFMFRNDGKMVLFTLAVRDMI